MRGRTGQLLLLSTSVVGLACTPQKSDQFLRPNHSASSLPRICKAGSPPAPEGPGKEIFYREVLFAAATAYTPEFDDYGPAGYHVDKLQMASELPSIADSCGVDLEGLVIIGPYGALWTYQIFTFLRDGNVSHMNAVAYPHARITAKGLRILSREEVIHWRTELVNLPYVHSGDPTSEDEFSYDLLVVWWDESKPRTWYASLREEEDLSAFDRLWSALYDDFVDTYIHSHSQDR